MDYNFSKDLKSIREILGVSQSELAEQIGVEQVTISRNESGKTEPSSKLLESIYSYAFGKNVKINKLKEMLFRDDLGVDKKYIQLINLLLESPDFPEVPDFPDYKIRPSAFAAARIFSAIIVMSFTLITPS